MISVVEAICGCWTELSDVREFGVYADDLVAICLWLAQNGTTSVAMQSTGSYWQNLYVELIRHGFGSSIGKW
ncbi:MAG: hypothetical protein IPN86_15400 [Saprospiraceae bacterium]|nr:hypothetical protein [Saprospiraceae bacterium]